MSSSKKIIISLFFIISCICIDAYRILGIFPVASTSHNAFFSALMIGLAKRGHHVDVVSFYPLKNPPPNYRTLIDLNKYYDIIDAHSFNVSYLSNCDVVELIGDKIGNQLCRFLSVEEMQRLIKNPPKDPPYDLVITEIFGTNCYLSLGHVLNVPVIGMSSAVEFPWVADLTQNHDNLAIVPSYFTEYFEATKFWHRLRNFLSHKWNSYKYHTFTDEVQNNLIKKYVGTDVPDIRKLEEKIALILVNRHPIIDGPKPVAPLMIEVGGLHLEEGDLPKLTPELKRWLDESTNGVIYLSFGSMIPVESLSSETLKDLYKSIAKIAPTKVLMKVVNETLLPPGLPKNTKLLSWIPQRAVLDHKNVRAFITHGGLMSLLESLYHAVPTIGVPIFSDQLQNLDKFSAMNITIKINLNNLTTTSMDEALNAVLNDPKYSNNAKLYSRLFKDRPMSAMNTAIFWVEYVARNGNILKPPNYKLQWWQLALLDVYVFLLICLILAITFIYYVTNHLTKKIVISLLQKYLSKRNEKRKVH